MENVITYIIGVILIGILVIFTSGCSALGVDLTDQRTYAITKAPYQIIVSGDLTHADKTAVQDLIKQLSKYPYEDYVFNETISVQVIGSETMIENINIKKSNDEKATE